MGFNLGYRGAAGGAVQTSYTDQPGIAVAGMLAFASDAYLADATFISETDGIAAGKGVVFAAGSTDVSNYQQPNVVASLPTVASVLADFGGILMFDEAMQSDENGVPGWADKRVGRVMRPQRAGMGRIWVKAVEAIDVATAGVHLVIVAGTDGLYEVGEFAPAALAGTALAGTSIDLSTILNWKSSAAAGGLALLEGN